MTHQTAFGTAKKLGGQSFFFFLGSCFTLLVGLPLQIYIARNLGTGGLGVFSLIEGGIGLISGLIGFGIAPTLVKFIPAYVEYGDYASARRLLRQGAIILTMGSVFAYVMFVLGLPLVLECWQDFTVHQTALVTMGLLIPIGCLSFFLQQALRGFQEIRYIVLGSSFMQLTVKALLSILLLEMGFQLLGYIWAVVASTLCASAWMGFGLLKKLAAMTNTPERPYQQDQANEWRKYAAIQYTGSLLGLTTQYLDRFLLGVFAGSAEVGVLAVLKQLQQMPMIFLQMFLAVAAPMFSAAHARSDDHERQHIYHLTTDWVVRLSLPLFVFFVEFDEPILELYGKEFINEGRVAFWIFLVGQGVNLGCGPVGNLLNISGYEIFMLRLGFFQTVLSTVLFVFLVPGYDLTGVAMTAVISTTFANLFALRLARKKLRLYWADSRYLRWIMPFIAASMVGVCVYTQHPDKTTLVLDLVIVYGVFHGVSFTQGINEDDRMLLKLLRSKLGFGQKSVV